MQGVSYARLYHWAPSSALFYLIIVYLFMVFETGSHIVQAGLKLAM